MIVPQVQSAFDNVLASHVSYTAPTSTPLKIPTSLGEGTLFGEISNRPYDKQVLEAQTILNTAQNRSTRRGISLSAVLTEPHQYQGYGSKEYQRYTSGDIRSTDNQKLSAIRAVLGQFESGKLENNIGTKEFYHHNPDGTIIATDKF